MFSQELKNESLWHNYLFGSFLNDTLPLQNIIADKGKLKGEHMWLVW